MLADVTLVYAEISEYMIQLPRLAAWHLPRRSAQC